MQHEDHVVSSSTGDKEGVVNPKSGSRKDAASLAPAEASANAAAAAAAGQINMQGSAGPPAPAANPAGEGEPPSSGNAGQNGGGSGNGQGGELAELSSTEISLDLQGLIDDSHFSDDNLFDNLVEAKKNELNNVYGLPGSNGNTRGSPSGGGSLGGSSGHSSPVGGDTSPSSFQQPHPHHAQHPHAQQQYRSNNTLTYLPGSVHSGYGGHIGGAPSALQIKQEPAERERAYAERGFSSSANGTVSSTTPNAPVAAALAAAAGAMHPAAMAAAAAAAAHHNGHHPSSHYPPTSMAATQSHMGSNSNGSVLPSLKTFAKGSAAAYLHGGLGNGNHGNGSSGSNGILSKKKVDRNSDEYRK